MDYTIISADSHLIEPRDLFVERLPEQYRDRAPRVVRGRDGGDGWSFDGSPPARTFGLEAVAGRKAEGKEYGAEGLTWDEILPGNYDGAAHLADMDIDGVDASVLYAGPIGLSSFMLPDRDLALALTRTYNDWLLDDFCAADRARLVGLALLPTDDGIEVMLAEFERCVGKGCSRLQSARVTRPRVLRRCRGGLSRDAGASSRLTQSPPGRVGGTVS